MLALKRSSTLSIPSKVLLGSSTSTRHLRTSTETSLTSTNRKEGDISSVFVSLSGVKHPPLPVRFARIKQDLIRGHEPKVAASWDRLLKQLDQENEIVKKKGSDVIPQIKFEDLARKDGKGKDDFVKEMKWRGVGVVKGVVEEKEARGYKTLAEEYIKANPSTKGFPANDPAVFELYWSPPQMLARSHPNIIAAQSLLMSNLWHTADPSTLLSTSQPLSYADRIRIRQPGDSQFALGPHIDGGSCERWEPNGYGIGGIYNKIFQGSYEEYDPWEAGARVPVVSDLYHGAGSCSMLRSFQGWLSMSRTGPGEGTLMVNPLNQLATAYFLLRPFFERVEGYRVKDTKGWKLKSMDEMDSVLQGATMGCAQELNDELHPNLELKNTMVHIPKINPGDFVVWHCDSIHAVDSTHAGKGDSSVIYIGVNPTTEGNVNYLLDQRKHFLEGLPGPDFPGGVGESKHVGRPGKDFVAEKGGIEGLRAMGLAKLEVLAGDETEGAKAMVQKANGMLGFA